LSDILEVHDLTAGYSGWPVLHEVSLRARKGYITGIIGPNGSGKSTLLKAIVGMISPTQGQVLFQGEDITGNSPFEILTQGLAYIPQGKQTFPDMSVMENLQMAAYTFRDADLISERFRGVFEHFPVLEEREKQPAGTLSGGEQSMLSFAMAMVLDPSCMLLDEPSLGLAPKMTEAVFNTIVELNEKGTSMIIVEQNVNVLLEVADYVFILDNGRNRYEGTREQVMGEEELMKMYMGVRA
jgi:ABC-type branched-subunit amino acid transport system ATPase component